jgi:hypothetical protein
MPTTFSFRRTDDKSKLVEAEKKAEAEAKALAEKEKAAKAAGTFCSLAR